MQPHQGLFVLDEARGIAGPCCGMMPAAMGADVMKLEPPARGGGDWPRGLAAHENGRAVMSAVFNRGKRNIAPDPSRPEPLTDPRFADFPPARAAKKPKDINGR